MNGNQLSLQVGREFSKFHSVRGETAAYFIAVGAAFGGTP
jgi:hypothetical protein